MSSENVATPSEAGRVSGRVARAQAEGLQLAGEGWLLQQLTKQLLKSALGVGMADRLGYGQLDPAGEYGGDSRNGKRSETSSRTACPVEIEMPRDRKGAFEPLSRSIGVG